MHQFTIEIYDFRPLMLDTHRADQFYPDLERVLAESRQVKVRHNIAPLTDTKTASMIHCTDDSTCRQIGGATRAHGRLQCFIRLNPMEENIAHQGRTDIRYVGTQQWCRFLALQIWPSSLGARPSVGGRQ